MYLKVTYREKDMGFSKLRPAVPRNWLIATAGVMWSAVGVILCLMAYHWLATVVIKRPILFGLAGFLLALVVYYFGFSRIARKNIDRLFQYPDKVCFFAFQAWRSYLIIAIMAALGAFLRHSSISRQYLAVVYLTIGGALVLSSLHYYVRLFKIKTHQPS
jgi:hypothetical protein